MLPVAAATRPPRIERSSPKRGASLVASMPAANTIMTVPAKNRPSWIGVKRNPSIRTRGAAENIANSPPMIRLTVAAGTRKRRSAIEAEIVFRDRQRIERNPRRTMGFAEHDVIGDGADGGEEPDKDEFGTPAEIMIERAAEQRREAGCGRHRDHDQRHRAGQCRAAEEIAGDGARQHRGRTGAGGLDDAADQQARQVGGEAAPDAAGEKHRKACQHRPAPAVAIRDRPDRELAEREHREENRDRRGHRRSRHLAAMPPSAAATAAGCWWQASRSPPTRQARRSAARSRMLPGAAAAVTLEMVWSAMEAPG